MDILLQGRTIPTTLVCLPDANKTLLGIDFLQAGNIAINLGQCCWYFAEDDFNQHELQFEDQHNVEFNDATIDFVHNHVERERRNYPIL